MVSDKIKYEIDPHNRLVRVGAGGLREVIEGRFKTTNRNELIYYVKRPVADGVPQQIKFRGSWELADDRRLVLTLDKWYHRIAGNKLTFATELIDAQDNEVAFTVTAKNGGSEASPPGDAGQTISLLRLAGAWQADAQNRLCFRVEDNEGVLKLQGEWRLNKRHEIEYDYAAGKQAFAFKGFWELGGRNRLRYVLNRVTGSAFDFRATLERALSDRIEYSLGAAGGPGKKTVTLFGSWKLNRRLELGFEVAYGEGRAERIVFGAKARIRDGADLELKLKTTDGRDLDAQVVLSRRTLDRQVFLKLAKEGAGKGVFIGMGTRF
ncbi:MAG: hypothetical protein ACM3L6_07945 [Deltaproteobacteria bacterium]